MPIEMLLGFLGILVLIENQERANYLGNGHNATGTNLILEACAFAVWGLLHLAGHVVAHLHILQAAGLLVKMPHAGLLVVVADWLVGHPFAIDVLHRFTFSAFFNACAHGVVCYIILLHSLCSQLRDGAEEPAPVNLQPNNRWFAMCLQLRFSLFVVTCLSLAFYAAAHFLGWSGIAAWSYYDVYILYTLQAVHTLLVLVFQWCAVGGLQGPTLVYNRLVAKPNAFFVYEVSRAACVMLACLALFVVLYTPMLASYILPNIQHIAPVTMASGCRLSGLGVVSGSWYVCASLANSRTHRRVLGCLLFISARSLSTLIFGSVCWAEVRAGGQAADWGFWKGLLGIVYGVASTVSASFRQLFQGEQPGNQEQQQVAGLFDDPLPVEYAIIMPVEQANEQQQQQPEPADVQSNRRFAFRWWFHTVVGYMGMCSCGAYCMYIVAMNALQHDPFGWRYEVPVYLIVGFTYVISGLITGCAASCSIYPVQPVAAPAG